MQHFGYTQAICFKCDDYTNHRIVQFDKAGSSKPQKICCKCHPERIITNVFPVTDKQAAADANGRNSAAGIGAGS